jgi:hypothetical protein
MEAVETMPGYEETPEQVDEGGRKPGPCGSRGHIYPGGYSLDVKFDKRYWVFIGAALFCSIVSSGSTLYLASVRKHFLECNSVSAECFMTIGMVPCMVLGILTMIVVMVAIPYIFRQNENLGVISMILMGLIVLYTALDAVNNISAIMGYYEAYQAAHGILSSTNNVTGNIVGTGESYC